MRLKASCGRLPKGIDLNDQVYSLTIIADAGKDLDIQCRLLSVLYKEARDGNLWYWCERMRKSRAKDQAD